MPSGCRANRRSIESHGYICTLQTDTEVITYIIDYLHRKKKLTLKEICSVIAAPFWSAMENMPQEEREELEFLRYTFASQLITGPFSIIVGFEGGMMALNDRNRRLILSKKFSSLFYTEDSLNNVTRILKDALSDNDFDAPSNAITISLPLPDGRTGTFKAVNSNICDRRGRPGFVIGKLIDVSEEVAEKKELLMRSQKDGMTDLYNAVTTKDLITEHVENKKGNRMDALILIDCDKFKRVNDTYGHLTGNQVLEHIASSLKRVFRNSDIIGRIGGDEFCVFLKNVPSTDLVLKKCHLLINQINSGVETQKKSLYP